MKEVTKESLAQWIAELESQPHLSLREERYLAVMKRCEELENAARTVHDTLVEIDEHNYSREDILRLNNASVEAILCLAPVLGEKHGHSEMWWAERMCNE